MTAAQWIEFLARTLGAGLVLFAVACLIVRAQNLASAARRREGRK